MDRYFCSGDGRKHEYKQRNNSDAVEKTHKYQNAATDYKNRYEIGKKSCIIDTYRIKASCAHNVGIQKLLNSFRQKLQSHNYSYKNERPCSMGSEYSFDYIHYIRVVLIISMLY